MRIIVSLAIAGISVAAAVLATGINQPVAAAPLAGQAACNAKYPGTTYRATDDMCACPKHHEWSAGARRCVVPGSEQQSCWQTKPGTIYNIATNSCGCANGITWTAEQQCSLPLPTASTGSTDKCRQKYSALHKPEGRRNGPYSAATNIQWSPALGSCIAFETGIPASTSSARMLARSYKTVYRVSGSKAAPVTSTIISARSIIFTDSTAQTATAAIEMYNNQNAEALQSCWAGLIQTADTPGWNGPTAVSACSRYAEENRQRTLLGEKLAGQ